MATLKHFPSSLKDWYNSANFWSHSTVYNTNTVVKIKDDWTIWWPYKCLNDTVSAYHPYGDIVNWEKIMYVEGDSIPSTFSSEIDPRIFDVRESSILKAETTFAAGGLNGAKLGQYNYSTKALEATYTITGNDATTSAGITENITGVTWSPTPNNGTFFLIELGGTIYTAFVYGTPSGYDLFGIKEVPYARALFQQIMPDQMFKLDHEPKVIKHTFGNGYVQIAPQGIKNDLRTFTATFGKLDAIDAESIRNFLKEHHSTPFWFMVPPPDWNRIACLCGKWDITYDQYKYATVNMSIEEISGWETY